LHLPFLNIGRCFSCSQLGEYPTIIELGRELLEDDEYKNCIIRDDSKQAWLYNSLANSFSLSGQPQRAIPLYDKAKNIFGTITKDKPNLDIGLLNLVYQQIMIGELDSAESNFKRSFELRREIENENYKMAYETVCHQELGRLLAYRGKFRESKKEIVAALKIAQKFGVKQNEGLSHVYLSICSLFMSNAEKALNAAKKARELADV